MLRLRTVTEQVCVDGSLLPLATRIFRVTLHVAIMMRGGKLHKAVAPGLQQHIRRDVGEMSRQGTVG